MKVAVTGAAGYLASVLIPKLQALPAVESILALDVRAPEGEAARASKLRFEIADVRKADLARLFAGVDAVIHLAFVVMPIADEDAVLAINVAGSERVFAAVARAGVRQLIYASSVAAYGFFDDRALPLDETVPPRDDEDHYYAHTKYLVEAALDRFERAHPEVAVARMRPGAFLGPGIKNLLGAVLRGPLLVDLGGMPPVQYAWDEDVADGFILALERRARGAFNLAGEGAVSNAEMSRLLGRRLVSVPRPLVRAAVRALVSVGLTTNDQAAWLTRSCAPIHVTSEKARRELGWRPALPASRDVLRRFAETTAGGTPNAGVALFLGALSILSRATGGRVAFGDRAAEANLRGMDAVVNLELLGEGGSSWSLRLRAGRVVVGPGLAPDATSTLRASTRTFVRLLAGDLGYSTAIFTGKVRILGEGHTQFILGSIVTAFRMLATAGPGLAGAGARAFAGLVLRLAREGKREREREREGAVA